MNAKSKFKSEAMEAIHETIEGMWRAGTVDAATMADFDKSCLSCPPEELPIRVNKRRDQDQ